MLPVGSKPLIVMALPIEAQGAFAAHGVEVLFTGVGKVNAAYHLTRALHRLNNQAAAPSMVLNFGTAGSPVFNTGTLLACHTFIQRDMDVRGLGFELGHTPFEEVPTALNFERVFHHLPAGVCATADRFETLSADLPYEVIDMEAYALAKVCHLEKVPFACAKYISDGADHNAATSWQASLPHAAEAFLKLYQWCVSPTPA